MKINNFNLIKANNINYLKIKILNTTKSWIFIDLKNLV